MRTTRGAAAMLALLASSITAAGSSAEASTPYPSAPAHAAVSACVPFALPAPDGWQGRLMDVNDNGTYVGGLVDASGNGPAAFWTHTGTDPSSGFTVHTVDRPEVPNAELLDINSSGVATGFGYDTGRGFVYNTVTGEFHLLPDFGAGGSYVWPRRINDAGVVAGGAYAADGTEYAGTWAPPYNTATRLHVPDEEQVMTWTDPVTGQVWTWKAGSEADGINNDGTVAVGYLQFRGEHFRRIAGNGRFAHDLGNSTPYDNNLTVNPPLEMTASGRVIQLNTSSGDAAYTFALNDTGTVVGDDITSWDPFTTRPVYWKGGREHDLGLPTDAQDGRALNINGDWATGGIEYPDGSSRSYIWTGSGSLQLGQPLPGFTNSWAHLVNAKLRQFGGESVSDTADVATVWQCPTSFSTS